MAIDDNGEHYIPEKTERLNIAVELGMKNWLYREKRRRDRSMSWIINQALKQYRSRTEKGLAKQND